MVTHNEALKKYINVLKTVHSINILYLDDILALPAIKCESYSSITEGNDVLLKVYRLNGYMLTRFIGFYEDFMSTIEDKAVKYCKKHRLNYLSFQKDVDKLTEISEEMLKKIKNKLEKGITKNESAIGINHYIKDMYAGIDLLITIEHEIKGHINPDELDVLGDVMFKSFRDNQLYTLTQLLLVRFPKSNNINVLKTDFYNPC